MRIVFHTCRKQKQQTMCHIHWRLVLYWFFFLLKHLGFFLCKLFIVHPLRKNTLQQVVRIPADHDWELLKQPP